MDSTGIDSTESFRRALVCFRDSHFYMTRQFPHRDLGNTFRGIDDAESYGSATIVERGVELLGVTYYKKNPWNRVTSFKEFYELSIEEGGALMHRETVRWNPRDSAYFFPPFSVAPKPSWW